jgi:hypothetical protein
VASVTGITTLRVGADRDDVLAVFSALAFVLALGCTLGRALTRPGESRYTGRAAAESARTLGWRYAVGGAPFALDEPASTTNVRLLKRSGEVIQELRDVNLAPPDHLLGVFSACASSAIAGNPAQPAPQPGHRLQRHRP